MSGEESISSTTETVKATPKKEEEYKIELLPEDYPQYDLSFKLIFIGDSSVGKSCLTTKAVKNNFEEYYQATVGFEFLTFNMKVNDKVVKLQIWDTCGQEIYKSLISNFYRNSSLAVLVYAIDNKESFIHVENWLNDLKSQANEDVRIFLVGNKSDLEDERKVTKEEGEKYKINQHLDLFMETSAKTGMNARNVLVEAAKILYNDYLKFDENPKNNDDKNKNKKPGDKLIAKPAKKEKGKCC
jgi:Ras-related protein Rab-6A